VPALRPLDHLAALSDDVGIIQHAIENVPNRATGYCTDDVARALMVVVARLLVVPSDPVASRLCSVYLAFLAQAQRDDGRFHNFMSYDRRWLDDVGTQDSNGRALWGLGYAAHFAADAGWRRAAARLFRRGVASLDALEYPHSEAYAVLGLCDAIEAGRSRTYRSALRSLAGRALERLAENSHPGWTWFGQAMTYDVARLPQALLRAGTVLDEPRFVEGGLLALRFYEGIAFENDVFVPIGNRGWYVRGGERARYDQQPLEAAAMVDAEWAAFEATGNPVHAASAQAAMAWYEGRNTERIVMEHAGGCYDGLGEGIANQNMGAESTLALLSAAYSFAVRRSTAVALAR
jgi:hypothetical protein